MLTPQYLDRLPRKLVGLYSDLEDAIISDIARRIVKADYLTPTAKWQIYKAKQLRLSNGEIAKLIQQKTGKSRQEIAKLMRTACFDALDPETQLYKRAGKKTEQFFRSEQFDKLVKAGIKNTNGLLKNFTRTTAKSADRALERLLDRAYMQMLSGAWSPQEVIAKAVRELADKGIQKIAYSSGHVDQADVAVRRALMTSVNQTSMQLSWAYADEMDCDLVEVTAHGGARPEHAKWQGRIFSRSGKHPVYPDFRKSTGYGTGEGLGGWNCRHSFHAYIEGFPRAYSDEHLKKLDDKTVSYNGKQYTEYEASQKQRKFERDIRGTKRQLAAYDSAIKAAADDALTADLQDAFTRQSVKLKSQEAKMRDFLRQTNRLEDSARTQAVGFDKSVSQKAVHSKKAVAKYAQKLYNLGDEETNLKAYYRDKPKYDNVNATIAEWRADKTIRARGVAVHAPKHLRITSANPHAKGRMDEREMTIEDARRIRDNAIFALEQRNGDAYAFYSGEGFVAVDLNGEIQSLGHLDEGGQLLFELVKEVFGIE